MAQDKKTKKKLKKDSQLVIRMNAQDRDEFVSLCEELDTSAAREVRAFIKGFMRQHAAASEAITAKIAHDK